MLLREENTFTIKDVEYAILEPNGKLSVLSKPEKETVTREDLRLPSSPGNRRIPTQVVSDGRIISGNLKALNLNVTWLEQELSKEGVTPDQVFYAEIQEDGSLFLDEYHDSIH